MADRAADRPRPPRTRKAPTGNPPQGDNGGATAKSPPASSGAPRRGSMARVRESLIGTYAMVGVMTVASSQGREDPSLQVLGESITLRAEAAADAWLELADQNPAVKRALIAFAEGSAIASLLTIHFAMLAPFLAAREVIPPMFAAPFTPPRNGAGPE